jgi:two-component system, NarL family, invasion response regulator UvrY
MNLLIVDDSPQIRAVLRKTAEEHSYVVTGEAENGKEALRLIPDMPVDMVLLDVSMPVMGGFETARNLQRIAPGLPILFISQHSDAEYVGKAFRSGARGYLLKSAISSELNQAIESVKNNQLYRSAQLAH